MTANLPSDVLSEHFEQRIRGRRLIAAVFATFQFDPGFFEQEVLPVLLDVPVSHAKPVRLLQLDDALRTVPGQIAVYYDANGIVSSDSGAPRLDVKRIPIRHPTGIFHPKNAFLLVEDAEADNEGHRARALLVASLSANLTRSGWWENVEACHVEEIAEGARTRLRDDLIVFLDSMRAKARAETDQTALRLIRKFLSESEQRDQRTTDGALHTHFFASREPLVDFLRQTADAKLRGGYLEVISPYFDDATTCEPLRAIIARFEPKEVRVFLPRAANGEALCRKELYDDIRELPNTAWGRLPKDFLRLGRANDAGERFVHAKVYRFFTQSPKREIYFVGSANLTAAAHNAGGNVETGFLVEVIPERRPEFWLTPDDRRPVSFRVKGEADDAAASGGTRLNLCYHWDTQSARVFWDSASESPELRLEGRGLTIGTLRAVPPRTWVAVDASLAETVRAYLAEHALLTVHGEGENPGLLLIQEEGLSHKPSLLLQLSAADILRYWALLTAAQRSAFLEARAPEVALTAEGADLVARAKTLVTTDTFFDRFAGFFHAFGCLERAVRDALDADNTRDATYRLFGKKHDSLGCLLERVLAGDGAGDAVDQYVIVLCADQMCREIARDYPDFWRERRADARDLESRFEAARKIRDSLVASDPASMPAFLDWFDRRFLARSRGRQVTEAQ